MSSSTDWLDWASLRSCVRYELVIAARAVLTSAWMFEGKEPPTPTASALTFAAAASVWLYQDRMAAAAVAGMSTGMSPAISSRSSSRACTRLATFCPRRASWVTRENCAALPAADATRRPPNVPRLPSASTLTAMSRHDTGQFRSRSAGRPRVPSSSPGVPGESPLPAASARDAACVTPWLPIADVLVPAVTKRSGSSHFMVIPAACFSRPANAAKSDANDEARYAWLILRGECDQHARPACDAEGCGRRRAGTPGDCLPCAQPGNKVPGQR